MDFCADYSRHFTVRGKDSIEHAKHYLSGLLGTQRRKNIGRIGEDVAESNYQGMQQFITDSPWDHRAVLDQVSREAAELLGNHRDAALYLDETSFVKKGEASVGVQRQYCGRLGKLENCQVGVFACLGRGERTALVDFRLFLPEDWAKDSARCERVKVPVEERVHRSKCELALALIKAARDRQLGHRWIGGDAIYGNNQEFCAALDALGEVFLMDVSCNVVVWTEDPQPKKQDPPPLGRPRTRAKAANEAARRQAVADLAASCFEAEHRMLTVRETTKGPLRAAIWVRPVWLWDQRTEHQAQARLLIIRRDADGSFKYSLSNSPADTSWERLAYMQGQRFFIERAFEDAKSELGMAQYEVRGWRGWHHHMTLCCLALLFTLKERIAYAEHIPLLSVRDIVELLAIYLPRRTRDPDAVLANLQARHVARASATKSAATRKSTITK